MPEEIRRQAEAAPCAALPAVTAALWRAYGEGQITEARPRRCPFSSRTGDRREPDQARTELEPNRN